ncbi:hypothetical protein GH975_06265 [Litorivicinus lipolyticus]|uniref:Alpha-2-macroglobulin n=1 Tax=Litorivicinus lipolyticus TaxID=418701 RepID=A0A5Q2Q745_9GAMM|nr:MG2 domain-containing protein [Litorivicinus lipolyticus]QGG80199.1 hypothetical protein GH975_06265 [Litorivicinus lipolyticus]
MRHFLSLSLWLLSTAAAAQPSFSCAGTVNMPDQMICDSVTLSALDNALAEAYADATRNTAELIELRKRQRAWVVERNNCRTDPCLAQSYQARISAVTALTRPLENSEYSAGRGKAEVRYELKKAIDPAAALGPFVRVTDTAGRDVEHGILLKDRTLTITGLEPSTDYDIRFRKGLPLSAGALKADQVVRANTPALRPGLQLVNGRGVVTLPAGKSPVVQYRATGREALHVRVSGILPAVAIRALQSGGLDRLGYTSRADEKLLHQQIIQLTPDRYGQAEGSIALGSMGLPAGTATLIEVSSCRDTACDRRYDRESITVVPSAMALSAARAGDAIWVSIRDYTTAQLIRSGSVTLYARNSEALGRFPIEQDGYARIPSALLDGTNGQRPSLLAAEHSQGHSYLSLLDAPLSLSQLPVQGAQSSVLGSAYLRTERGVYRPSESVHFSGIARATDQQPLASTGLLLEVVRPDGKRIDRRPVQSDHNGLVTASLQLGAIAKRGTYRAVLKRGESVIGRTRFQVQDFVPETMEVAIHDVPVAISPADTLTVNTQSDYLFGAPGSHRPITLTLRQQPDRRAFAAFDGFVFGGLDDQNDRMALLDSTTLTTAQGGEARFSFAPAVLSAMAGAAVPQRLSLTAELEELSGRITRQATSTLVATQPRWVGVKPVDGARWYATNSQPQYSVMVADSFTGQAHDGGVRWRLIKEDWDYYWYTQNGDWNYSVTYQDVGIRDSGTVMVENGLGTLTLPPLAYGRYKLELMPSVGQPTQTRLQVGWWSTSGANAAIPDTLDMAVSNPTPAAGQAVTVTLEAPFNGRAEIMVVGEGVHQTLDVALVDRKAEISVTPPESADQVYILAKAYRAGQPDAPGPSRAVGAAHLTIEPERFLQATRLTLPDLVRPNTRVQIEVDAPGSRDGATVVATLVDVGILNLTGHAKAAPHDWFTRKRALDATLYDGYGLVARMLSDFGGQTLTIGGDEGGEADAQATFFETIARQSNPVRVKNGKALIGVDIGQLNGRVRVDVMGSDGARSLQASGDITVRDPVAVTSSVPRTLAHGDQFIASAGLTLTEGDAQRAKLTWRTEGPFSIQRPLATVDFQGAGQTQTVRTPVAVTANGAGRIALDVELADGEVLSYAWPVTARAPGSIITLRERFELPANGSKSLPMSMLESLEDGTASVSVSRVPMPDASSLLASLSRYPYGCLEQTVSKAIPLALMDAATAESVGFAQAQRQLARSYRRLADLQQPSGLFNLWSWRGDSERWLSLYALDFLRLPIPDRVFDSAEFDSLERLRVNMIDAMRPNLNNLARASDTDVKAYALMHLAESGQPDVGEMRYLLQQASDLSPTALAQLGYGFAVTGDDARARAALRAATQSNTTAYRYSSYRSPLRARAATAYYAIKAEQAALSRDAIGLMDRSFSDERRLSTQEKAWVYRAVNAAAVLGGANDADWSLSGDAHPNVIPIDDVKRVIESRIDTPLYVTFAATGARADAPAPDALRRAIGWLTDTPAAVRTERTLYRYDAQFNPLPLATESQHIEVNQGDLIMSVVTTRTEGVQVDGEWLVEEKAPGGLEVENPNLGGLDAIGLLESMGEDTRQYDEGNAVYLDDRYTRVTEITRFQKRSDALTLASNPPKSGWLRTLSLWRAVTPGVYRYPGAAVENMLNPSLNAQSPSLTLTVRAR